MNLDSDLNGVYHPSAMLNFVGYYKKYYFGSLQRLPVVPMYLT